MLTLLSAHHVFEDGPPFMENKIHSSDEKADTSHEGITEGRPESHHEIDQCRISGKADHRVVVLQREKEVDDHHKDPEDQKRPGHSFKKEVMQGGVLEKSPDLLCIEQRIPCRIHHSPVQLAQDTRFEAGDDGISREITHSDTDGIAAHPAPVLRKPGKVEKAHDDPQSQPDSQKNIAVSQSPAERVPDTGQKEIRVTDKDRIPHRCPHKKMFCEFIDHIIPEEKGEDG
jgi:hypothetical protein